jgi:hypothetical protein
MEPQLSDAGTEPVGRAVISVTGAAGDLAVCFGKPPLNQVRSSDLSIGSNSSARDTRASIVLGALL